MILVVLDLTLCIVCVNSLSHTVYSINVHILEDLVDGEVVLKNGGINVVDLACNEVHKEGSTDHSLLTLERVIQAHSEKATNVPYRYAEQGCPIANVLPVNVV